MHLKGGYIWGYLVRLQSPSAIIAVWCGAKNLVNNGITDVIAIEIKVILAATVVMDT